MLERDKKLQAAVRHNQPERVRQLLQAGADPDIEGPFGGLLFMALLLNYVEVAQLLVEAGSDIDAVDDRGWTPLHWAAKIGDKQLFRLMVESEADPGALDNDGKTPLDILNDYQHDDVLAMVEHRFRKEYARWKSKG